MENSTKLMNVQAAAAYLASIGAPVGVHFIRALITGGEIAFLRMGKRYFVSREALDGWIRTHERRVRRQWPIRL